jgi:hypothetical protein
LFLAWTLPLLSEMDVATTSVRQQSHVRAQANNRRAAARIDDALGGKLDVELRPMASELDRRR